MRTAAEVVRVVAPGARIEYVDALVQGEALLQEYGITTPLRLAHFLAQILHESGGLKITFENMNYRASRILEVFGVGRHSAAVTPAEARTLAGNPAALAERVYGLGNPRKAQELGNLVAGDAYKCRGGGILQTTGAGAYKRYGQLCGVDFYGDPSKIVSRAHALKPALYEWKAKGCNALADRNDIGGITRKVNGGTNGLESRKQWFARVYPLCKGDEKPQATVADAWEDAEDHEDVRWLQQALNDLGYNPPLDVDGRQGVKTVAAVKWFQRKAGCRDIDGDAGPETMAALRNALNGRKNEDPAPKLTTTAEGKAAIGLSATTALETASTVSGSIKEIKGNLAEAGVGEVLTSIITNPQFLVVVLLAAGAIYLYLKHRERV